jgi:SAM-dependent methyltransferase
MSQLHDQAYLRTEQYSNPEKLASRIQFHQRYSINNEPISRWIYDQFAFPANACVLELGGGAGDLWDENRDRLPENGVILLSDLSVGMVMAARRRLMDTGYRFQWLSCDAQTLPFVDQSIDVVIANFMLYHVPDRERAFAEIHRVLRPHGRLYAATVGAYHLSELAQLMHHYDPPLAFWGGAPNAGFTLQNGAAQLAPYFSEITLHRFENALEVSAVEPLVRFIRSFTPIDDREIPNFTAYLKQAFVAQGGVFRIQKETGVLGGRRRDLGDREKEHERNW